MRKFTTLTLLALALSFGAATAHAQMGYLSAVHGIPGLAEPVDVYANGSFLASFEYGQTIGPVPVPADSYNLEVYYQNNVVLSDTAVVEEGGSYTAVAHLDGAGSIAPLSLFVNETSPTFAPGSTLARGSSFIRLQIFHLAAAPTVDASIRRGYSSYPILELSGLSNGDQATAFDFLGSPFNVGLLYNDGEVFNTGLVDLPSGTNLGVYAVGVFPDTFQLIYLPLN